MKTLFVTDLDGTLMRSDLTVSDFSVNTINSLVEQGISFTYATARSIVSARTITSELKLKLPVITRNGAVLADNNTGNIFEKSLFSKAEVELLKELITELPNCTKAKSILKLKEEYGFEKLVVFGDSVNDLPMFKIADESYAVSNAIEELKAQATKVIGSNEEDAVAKFLMDYLDSSITV